MRWSSTASNIQKGHTRRTLSMSIERTRLCAKPRWIATSKTMAVR